MFHVAEEHVISGIFIKHVLEDSPAGRNGTLKTGDRILQVGSTLCECLHHGNNKKNLRLVLGIDKK